MAKKGSPKPALSGRKSGSGPYGHPTVPVRVPEFLVGLVKTFVRVMVHINRLKPINEQEVKQSLENMKDMVG